MKQIKFILFILFPVFTSAQNIEQTLIYAQHLLESHQYNQAQEVARRVLFFSDGKYHEIIYPLLADCAFAEEKYQQAYNFYARAAFSSFSDSTKNEFTFMKIRCQILSGNYTSAKVDLVALDFKNNIYFTRKKIFYTAVLYFAEENFQQSEAFFLELVPKLSPEYNEIQHIFLKKKKLLHPNADVAFWLSVVLPGSGQAYSGDIKNAINSPALLGLLVYSGMRIAQTYSRLDAFLAIAPWYWRYYIGGVQKTKIYANNRRYKKQALAFAKIIQQIEIYQKRIGNVNHERQKTK